MKCAGFVLAGGRSARMGRDKALLPFRGCTLIEHVAAEVKNITKQVSLVGDIRRYRNFSYPVVEDIFPGKGPLAGIHAALAASAADWNLIVACDMPEVTFGFLGRLLERAGAGCADAVLPVGSSGRAEPLCAAYHRRSLDAITRALTRGVRKVSDGLVELHVDFWPVADARFFRNLNTPQEWSSYSNG